MRVRHLAAFSKLFVRSGCGACRASLGQAPRLLFSGPRLCRSTHQLFGEQPAAPKRSCAFIIAVVRNAARSTGGNWNACLDVVPRLCFTSGKLTCSILEEEDQQQPPRLPLYCNHELQSWMLRLFFTVARGWCTLVWKTDDNS